jgi:hypothetical protein
MKRTPGAFTAIAMKIFGTYWFFTSDLLQTGGRTLPPGKIKQYRHDALPAETLPEASAADRQFEVFAILWAVATLFHMAHSGVFDSQLNYALLSVAALYVVFRPSLPGFVLLILLQLFDAVYRMPLTTNHWIFTAFVNLTILHTILYLVVRRRSFTLNRGDVLLTFAPIVRAEVIILYFFTFFHKLNAGFFSSGSSCAADLLKAQHIDALIPLNDTTFAFSPYFTIIIEFMIPVLLCFKQTKHVGILTGLFFHCVLSYSSYNAFYDFSSMLFAVYFLFAGPGFADTIVETLRRLRTAAMAMVSPGRYSIERLLLSIFCVVAALAMVYWLNKKLDTFKSFHLYFFWAVYSALFVYCFMVFWVATKRKHDDSLSFVPRHWSFYVLPCIVFLNGAAPYLGLKTENSFAMFSNLRTEGGITNHYIIPVTFQVFPYQKDVVQIVSSSDPYLQSLAVKDKQLVLFEFSNYVHQVKPVKVEYLLNGKRNTFPFQEGSPGVAIHKNPYILSKLMKFRPFSRHEPQPCAH